MKTTVRIYLNRYDLDKNGNGPISICLTINRVKRYFPIDLEMQPDRFDKIMASKRRSKREIQIYDVLQSTENRAKDIVKNMPIPSFELFKERFYGINAPSKSLAGAFEAKIKELQDEDREYETYTYAKKSLLGFRPNITFVDITPKFLREYEKHMLASGNSLTTVGIYLRNLRHIFNRAKIDESIYPFGVNKYEIPNGKNIKKALTLDDVVKIANYETQNESAQFARDMWIFSFQANGMNMKDVFSLKRSNISDNMIVYVREKTIRTKRESSKIQVSLKPESREIIQRWGNVIQLGEKDPYIFPFLKKDMSHRQIKSTVKQLVQNINNWMKKIAKELGIEANVTTYYARHSFATILKRSGVSTEFISDSLGHGNVKTTASYLAGFEDEAIHKNTEVLTGLKKSSAS